MDIHPNTMPQTMSKFLAVAGFRNDMARSSIHFGRCNLSGLHGNDSRSLGIHHKFVNALIFRIGFTKEDCATKIVAKSLINMKLK